MKKLLIIFLLTVVFPSCVLAKGYRGYVSHYWTAFVIERTEFDGGSSYYKHYLTPEFKTNQTALHTPRNIPKRRRWKKDILFTADRKKCGSWAVTRIGKRWAH